MTRLLSLALVVCILAIPSPARAATLLPPVPLTPGAMTPADAVELGLAQDGVEIVLQGEAIGEALAAPGGKRWVNLLGDAVAIGVVVDAKGAAEVTRFGEYRQRGATLLVRGRLNSACDDHGGDLDVHATSVRIIDAGHTSPHVVHPNKLLFAAAAAVAAMGLVAHYRRLRRRTFL